jgi:hypothetical protein
MNSKNEKVLKMHFHCCIQYDVCNSRICFLKILAVKINCALQTMSVLKRHVLVGDYTF